jgi:hypothetical protein
MIKGLELQHDPSKRDILHMSGIGVPLGYFCVVGMGLKALTMIRGGK